MDCLQKKINEKITIIFFSAHRPDPVYLKFARFMKHEWKFTHLAVNFQGTVYEWTMAGLVKYPAELLKTLTRQKKRVVVAMAEVAVCEEIIIDRLRFIERTWSSPTRVWEVLLYALGMYDLFVCTDLPYFLMTGKVKGYMPSTFLLYLVQHYQQGNIEDASLGEMLDAITE